MANTVDREGRREKEIRDYDTSALPSGSSFSYMIVRPENGGILDLIKFLIVGEKAKPSGTRFVDSSSSTVLDDGDLTPDHRWVIFVSIIVRKIIGFLGKSMEWTGFCVDFFLNLLSLNGGIAGLFYNAFNGNSCSHIQLLSKQITCRFWIAQNLMILLDLADNIALGRLCCSTSTVILVKSTLLIISIYILMKAAERC